MTGWHSYIQQIEDLVKRQKEQEVEETKEESRLEPLVVRKEGHEGEEAMATYLDDKPPQSFELSHLPTPPLSPPTKWFPNVMTFSLKVCPTSLFSIVSLLPRVSPTVYTCLYCSRLIITLLKSLLSEIAKLSLGLGQLSANTLKNKLCSL